MKSRDIALLVAVVGVLLVAVGCALVWPPGLIVTGVICTAYALVGIDVGGRS